MLFVGRRLACLPWLGCPLGSILLGRYVLECLSLIPPVPWRAPYRGVLECFCTCVLLLPVAWKSLVEGFWVALAPYVPTWLGRPLSMEIGGRGVETFTVICDGVPDPY